MAINLIALQKSFLMIYCNTHLNSHETVPLICINGRFMQMIQLLQLTSVYFDYFLSTRIIIRTSKRVVRHSLFQLYRIKPHGCLAIKTSLIPHRFIQFYWSKSGNTPPTFRPVPVDIEKINTQIGGWDDFTTVTPIGTYMQCSKQSFLGS